MRRGLAIAIAAASVMASGWALAGGVRLHAAGSLRAALTEAAADFATAEGVEVETVFGPSGLLRERIEGGEAARPEALRAAPPP